jgi:hypothetical protein
MIMILVPMPITTIMGVQMIPLIPVTMMPTRRMMLVVLEE